MPRILLADDAGVLAEALVSKELDIQRAAKAVTALKQFDAHSFDCVVSKNQLPDLDGLALLRRVGETAPGVSTVLLLSDIDELHRTADAGVDHVLPYDTSRAGDLATEIRRIVTDSRMADGLARHAELKAAVSSAVQGAIAADTPEEIERAVCRTLVGEGHYTVAWVSVYDEDTGTLVPRTAAGIDVTSLAGQPVADDLEPTETVEVHVTNSEPSPSTATVTLRHGDTLHGVLQLSADRPIRTAERDLLETLGTTVAATLESTRRGDVGPETVAFSGTLSHELRNSLQIAQAQLQLARDEDGEEYFERVQTALDRIERLADEAEIVAHRRIHADDLTFRDLAESASAAANRVNESRVELTVTDSRPVEAHHGLLELLLENLFRNSAEHGSAEVRLGTLTNGFYVEDSGPGIPTEKRDQVFHWGYATSEDGAGFGLAIVKRIADAHGWDIAVTDGDDAGARFEITGV